VHPSFQCRVVLSLEPLQQRGFELTNTTTAGSGVEAVHLLESIEAVCDESSDECGSIIYTRSIEHNKRYSHWYATRGLVASTSLATRDLDQRGWHRLTVEDGLPQVPHRLRP
jgi:hypothetical protein